MRAEESGVVNIQIPAQIHRHVLRDRGFNVVIFISAAAWIGIHSVPALSLIHILGVINQYDAAVKRYADANSQTLYTTRYGATYQNDFTVILQSESNGWTLSLIHI